MSLAVRWVVMTLCLWTSPFATNSLRLSALAEPHHDRHSHNGTHHHRHPKQFDDLEHLSKFREQAIEAHIGIFMIGTSKSAGSYYRRNAQAAHDTWARPFPLVFSVQGDSPNSRFAHRSCNLQWIDTGINASHGNETQTMNTQQSSSSFSEVNMKNEPWPRDPLLGRMLVGRCHREVGVLLVPACDDSYYGHMGPCCKLDAALVFATAPEAAVHVFGGKPLKHMMFMDDDNYLRLDAFLPWLKSLDEASAEPLVCAAGSVPNLNLVKKMETCKNCGGRWVGRGAEHKYRADKCKEVAPGMPTMTQQLVFNAVALRRVRDAAARGGNRVICSNGKGGLPLGFSVTHDVGFGVFAWQHALHLCSIPGVKATAQWTEVLKMPPDALMILHGAKERGRAVGCDQERFGGQMFDEVGNKFAASARVEGPERVAALWQSPGDDDAVHGAHSGRGAWASAAACRGINHSLSADWFSQYDAHSYFKSKKAMNIKSTYLTDEGKLPLRMPLYGYDRTAHSKRSQETKGSTWAPFLPSDCA